MMGKTGLYALAAAGALAVAAPIYAIVDEQQDKAKAEKELKDLESQRAKLDSRIRELNKTLGRPSVEIREFNNFKDLTPEQKAKIEQKIKESMKNLPDVSKIIEKSLKGLPDQGVIIEKSLKGLPDVGIIVEKSLKGLPNFQTFNFDGKDMTPEQREKFKADMHKWADEFKKNFKPDAFKFDGDAFKKGFNSDSFRFFNSDEFKKNMEEFRKNFKPGQFDFKFDNDSFPKNFKFDGDAFQKNFKFDVGPDGKLKSGRGGDASPEVRKEIEELRRMIQQLRDDLKKGKGGDVNNVTPDPEAIAA